MYAPAGDELPHILYAHSMACADDPNTHIRMLASAMDAVLARENTIEARGDRLKLREIVESATPEGRPK